MNDDTPFKKVLFPVLTLLGVLIILVYSRMLDNFFYYDDFEWLESRIRNFEQEPLSMFKPIVHPPASQLTSLPPSYFTPLIYITFWANKILFGLDPFGYHLFNLILHILNSFLVIHLVFLLSRNLPLATLAGLFFALNFAITDAVIWPAAYVDTVMFFFYILSLISFIIFLRKGRPYYLLSIILFILSLSAKGTALTLPLALFFIEKYLGLSKDIKSLIKYIPYSLIVLAYLALLRYSSPYQLTFGQTALEQLILNSLKVPMTLLIPEWFMPIGFWWTLLCVLLLSILVVSGLKKVGTSSVGGLGVLLMLVGVLPLFAINWSFPSNPDPLTESIRHRLYLGNLGFSIFVGSVFNYYLYTRVSGVKFKIMMVSLLIAFIGINIFWNQKIQYKWDKITNDTRNSLNEFKKMAAEYSPHSAIYFINFPPNQGFPSNFFRLYLADYKFNIGIWPTKIPAEIERQEINIFLQLNGHIYNMPDMAAKETLTPWDHFYVSQFYLLKEENDKGLSELDKAVALNADGKLHYMAATSYLKLGFKDKAVDELKKTIALNPYLAKAYAQLGNIYYETGKYDLAIEALEKVVFLDKKDFRTMEDLALLYEAKGAAGKAKKMWEKALRYEDREEFRKRIKGKLSMI